MAENTSCGINGGNRSETHPMDIAAKSATEQMVEELQRILDLAVPAKEEISKLINVNQSKQVNKETQGSDISKDNFDLKRKLSLAYEENSKLQQQLQDVHDVNKTKLAKYEEAIDAYKDVQQNLEQKVILKADRINDLHDELTKLKERIKSINKEKEQQNKELNNIIQQTKKEKENAAKEFSETKSRLEKEYTLKEKEIEDLKTSKNNLAEKAKTFIKDRDQEIKDLRNNLQQTKTEKENLSKELSETKSRLSKVMGEKLSDNNPDIADLSDDNRPTKLAEKYQELYDNQWTDAYEIAEKTYENRNEQEIIHALLTILMRVYMFCKDEAESQKQELVRAVYRIQSTEKLKTDLSKPVNIKEFLKQCKRSIAKDTINNLTENFLNIKTTEPSKTFYLRVKEYVHECVNLCWMMERHDPPLVLLQGVHEGEKFDGNRYKPYTSTGTIVEFVVWPALLLHHEGPLLSKGVVQCTRPLQGSKSFTSELPPRMPKEDHTLTGSVRVRDNGTSLSTTVWLPGKQLGQPEQVSTYKNELSKNEGLDQQRIKTSQVSVDNKTGQPSKQFHSEIKTQLQVSPTLYQESLDKPMVGNQTPIQYDVGRIQYPQSNENMQHQAYVGMAANQTPGQSDVGKDHFYQRNKSMQHQADVSANKQYADGTSVKDVKIEVLNEHNQPQQSPNASIDQNNQRLNPLNQASTNFQSATQQQYSVPRNVQNFQLPPHLIPSHQEMDSFYRYNNYYKNIESARYYMGAHSYDKCYNYWIWSNQHHGK